ncbi:MAG: peptide chain release factor 1 [Planctomycetes bacterium]|nr:peptide chain release factor 1 [Planctomycetota bacterium]
MARVEEMAQRGAEVAAKMNQPEVAASGALMVKLAHEHGQLEKTLKTYREYRAATDQLNELQQILADPESDADLRELAEAELPELEQRRELLLRALQERLVTSDEGSINSIILEIRAGTGGEEAALFARELLDMYLAYAARKGFKSETLSLSSSDLGGVKEAIVNIIGPEAYMHYRFEGGGHRVQRVPQTESQGRIHTSAATVAVLPEPEEVEIDINWDTDVVEHVSRAGGPGGQNVNKVSSAIRLEHPETGITVSMRDDKSQHKNRAKARRIMLSRLYEHHQRVQRQKIDSDRRSMVGSGDRSERIRTYNFPQNRCTDHRLNKDVFGLERILVGGEFDEFLAELHERDLRLRLEAL